MGLEDPKLSKVEGIALRSPEDADIIRSEARVRIELRCVNCEDRLLLRIEGEPHVQLRAEGAIRAICPECGFNACIGVRREPEPEDHMIVIGQDREMYLKSIGR